MKKFSEEVRLALLGKTYIFSVGQAGYIVKSSNGQLLAIDLYLSECVEKSEGNIGFKRLLPQILEPGELIFDCVIATHPHYDHFDIDTVPALMNNEKTMLFASINCRREVRKLGMNEDRITYVASGEIFQCGDFGLEFTNCDHGDGAPDAVGVIITVDGKRIFEAGDTCLRLDWIDALKGKGPYDVLIAPINGAFGNLNEEECAKLSGALEANITVPCHYGMFASHGGNPGLFYEIMKSKYPDNKMLLLRQGEHIEI